MEMEMEMAMETMSTRKRDWRNGRAERLSGIAPVRDREDKVEWLLDDTKEFSVKKMREILEESEYTAREQSLPTKWSKLIPGKVCIFVWRVRLGRIPSHEILDKRGIDLDSVLCPRCDDEIESINHALVTCPEVKIIWRQLGKWWKQNMDGVASIQDILQDDNSRVDTRENVSVWSAVKWAALFLIWSHRNEIVFKGSNGSIVDKLFEWQRKMFEWISERSNKTLGGWNHWLENPT